MNPLDCMYRVDAGPRCIVVRSGESVLADAVFAIRALLPTLQLLRLDLPQVANIAEHSDLGVIVDISVTKQCVAGGIA